jgi:EAL domain-containing protein (putative c-di-GMP-specific phosphodiesterase class I)
MHFWTFDGRSIRPKSDQPAHWSDDDGNRLGCTLSLHDLQRRASYQQARAANSGRREQAQVNPKTERGASVVEHLRNFNYFAGAVTEAMQEGRIGFSLQHVNSLEDAGDVLYSECLGRLVEPDGTVRTIGEFIAFLEATGRVAAFDRHMIGLAFEWLDGHPTRVLGCNVSAANIADERHWADLHDLLFRNRKMASRLVLEITESLPIATLPSAAEFLRSARALGYKIALDDFGTGYATPEALLSIPVDMVKVDAFFIQQGRGQARRFLHHIVGLASCVAPIVIVEGIETYAQLEAARAAGATHVQGFLLSEPTLVPVHCGLANFSAKAFMRNGRCPQFWN